MRKTILLSLIAVSSLGAQTMILTPSYISTLKTRAASNTIEWQQLRSVCDYRIGYTTATPDHLPPVYASMEDTSDGQGNDQNSYMLIGTDGNYYEGNQAMDIAIPLGVCYLILKDGEVTPSGWNYSWNGIRLSAQQYGILAGMQAVKILNKTTPTIARMTVRPVRNHLGWRRVAR